LGLSIALASFPLLARAEDPTSDARFEQAAESLAQGRYDDAETTLEELVHDRGFAPGVLDNLGEAYLAQGELGHAIVAFERARLLAPNDPAIAEGLAEARQRAGVTAPPRSKVETLASLEPARRWLAVGGGALLVFVLLAGLVAVRRRVGPAIISLSIASGLVTALAAGALWVGTFGPDEAVALSETTARVSPFEAAETVFELRPGETVEAIGSHDGYLEVRTQGGQRGWVDGASIERVVPRDHSGIGG
jgi:tetratricopeptide (TPR) repeat protein